MTRMGLSARLRASFSRKKVARVAAGHRAELGALDRDEIERLQQIVRRERLSSLDPSEAARHIRAIADAPLLHQLCDLLLEFFLFTANFVGLSAIADVPQRADSRAERVAVVCDLARPALTIRLPLVTRNECRDCISGEQT